MAYFKRLVNSVSRVFHLIGAWVLAAMMLLIVVNILSRYFYQSIVGTFEIVGLMGAVLISTVLAYTAMQNRNVAIELMVSHLPPRAQAIIDSFVYLLSIAIVSLMAWRTVVQAHSRWLAHEATHELFIPLAPFILITGVGIALLVLVLVIKFVESLTGLVKK